MSAPSPRGIPDGPRSSRGEPGKGPRIWAPRNDHEASDSNSRSLPIVLLKEKAKGLHRSTTSSKICIFGDTELPLLPENGPGTFRRREDLPTDTVQRCLLDNALNADTKTGRVKVCKALQYYFSKILQPPVGKCFAYYVLMAKDKTGIYPSWYELLAAKNSVQGDYFYKGFYSFIEAVDYLHGRLDEQTSIEFTHKEPREGPSIEAQAQNIRSLEDEILAMQEKLSAAEDLLTKQQQNCPPDEDYTYVLRGPRRNLALHTHRY